jgi:Derlin-2/3
MAQAVEEWYRQMPIITRSYLTAAVVTTVGCTLDIISPYHLYLNPKLVVQQYEIWRLVTNFLYFRKMGMCSLSLPLPWPASARRCDVMSELYVG